MKLTPGARVVVTGAATGVGRALAVEAAARGADVVAIDVHDTTETVAIIVAAGGSARGAIGDVRDYAAMQSVAVEAGGDDGFVDVVCANAGVGGGGGIDDVTSDGLREILEVNVLGAFHTIQAFLPALRRAQAAGRTPSVLITGSEHSLGLPPYVAPMTAYTTSKHALLGLAACIRRDLAAEGITVSLLCPSYVRTERLQSYAASAPALAEALDTYGQDGDAVARRAFDGLASGSFLIPTNPVSGGFVIDFHRGIIESMDQLSPSSQPSAAI
jgi:NAD(P)-dependent dehydrogenase (short-subunit alcohol dehydrogenase family)